MKQIFYFLFVAFWVLSAIMIDPPKGGIPGDMEGHKPIPEQQFA